MKYSTKLLLSALFLVGQLTIISATKQNSFSTQRVIAPSDSYWDKGQCRNQKQQQSPIAIKPPFTYLDFHPEWNFSPQEGGYLKNEEGYNLEMTGDFGSFDYQDQTFNAYKLTFKSPSEHTFGPNNQHFPMELQIKTTSAKNVEINIAIMFSKSEEDGPFLAKFGFGNGLLQQLSENEKVHVNSVIDLNQLVPHNENWLIYKGSETSPPCTPALWFVSFGTFKVSENQLNDFPVKLQDKIRQVQTTPEVIYSSFKDLKTAVEAATPVEVKASDVEPTLPSKSQQEVINTEGGEGEEGAEGGEEKKSDDKGNKGSQGSTTKSPPAEARSIHQILNKQTNTLLDPFTVVGDSSDYEKPIYPSFMPGANSRFIDTNDYLVITGGNDVKPFLDFLTLDKDKLKKLLNQIENKKITQNLAMAKDNGQLDVANEVQNKAKSEKSDEEENGDSIDEAALIEQTKKQFQEEEKKNSGLPKNVYVQVDEQNDKIKQQKAAKEEIVSVFKHPQRGDPSKFFMEKSYNPLKQKSQKQFFSMLELTAGVDKPSTAKKDEKVAEKQPEPPAEAMDAKALTSALIDLAKNGDESMAKNIMVSLFEKLNEHKDDPEWPTAVKGFYDKILSQIQESKNVATTTDSNYSPDPIDHEMANKKTQLVWGPKVTSEVRNMYDTTNGKGLKSFDQNGVWDGIEIYDTQTWPDFCKIGLEQSPIHVDFQSRFEVEPLGIKFNYEVPSTKYVELHHDGYKLMLNGDFGYIQYGEHRFEAQEVHFHHPSEHTFGADKNRTDMEIQIIHRDGFGLTVAVSVLLNNKEDNKSNKFMDELGFTSETYLEIMVAGDNQYIESESVKLQELVGDSFDFIKYTGSITTPPCTENVQWFLLNKRKDVSKQNIEAFTKILGAETNVRGTQPLNDRALHLF